MTHLDDQLIENLPMYSEKSAFRGSTGDFYLTVKFMVANPVNHDVSCCKTEIGFHGEFTVRKATQFALDNFAGTLDVPQFCCRAVFYQEPILKSPFSWLQDPKMLGTLDQKLEEVFVPRSTMWISNDPRCFEFEMNREIRKNRLLILGMVIVLVIIVLGPELLAFIRTLVTLRYGKFVVYCYLHFCCCLGA